MNIAATSDISIDGNIVTKTIHPWVMERFPHVYVSEVCALKELSGKPHFPTLIDHKPGIINMSYCGKSINITNIPDDWELQMYEILYTLDECNIIHNDLLPRNLLIDDHGIINVIDFGVARFKGESHPKPIIFPPERLAQVERDTDEIVLRRSLDYIRGKTIDNYNVMPLPDKIDWAKCPEWQSIQNAIGCLGTEYHIGSSITPGHMYHEIPFRIPQKVHRKGLQSRINRLIGSGYDFAGKRGLDIGSSVGGLTFSLQLMGAKCHGIEADKQAYDVAIALEEYYNTGATFKNTTIEKGLHPVHYDFCLYLNVFMWIVKSSGIKAANKSLVTLSRHCPVMFFETSLGDSAAGDVMKEYNLTSIDRMLSYIERVSDYRFSKYLGVDDAWSNRPMVMMKSIFNT